ncbi:glutathione ABC transporter substrate-binding protein [Sporosarcina siberiensis]|uniref:Glutathione ABC transporter substrate-binding protein n=1 Tax=Sporosarcina siberiensis TaxID=1365606 RepID=A0ABW4SJJ3_9BACL
MKKNHKFSLLLVLTIIMSLFLAACAGGSDTKDEGKKDDATKDEGKTEDASSDGASDGGDLVIATLSDAALLDPQRSTDVPSANIQTNLFEGLVTKDKDSNIVESLAVSWEPVDETTWEFKLREGVKFHDGEDLNAEAVKKSFARIQDPDVAAPRAFIFEMITDVTVIDDLTVQIKTEYPFAPLLAHLSHPAGVIVSPKQIDLEYEAMKNGEEPSSVMNENPIGTGFFKFESWVPGTEIVLVKNEDYWGDKVHVDKVTFKVIPEGGTRVAELKTGNAQIIEPVQPNEVADLNSTDNVTVDEKVSSSLNYLGFNMDKKPFDDVRVRQAITMLVNVDEVLEGVYEGFGITANGPLAPGVFGYNSSSKPIGYDVEKAKELLKEAGLEDGFKTTIWTNDNQQRMDIAVILQQALAEVNIEVDIQVLEWGAYLANTAEGEHEMFILGLSNPVGDADYFLTQLFHSDNKGVSGNRSFYDNPELDKLLEDGRKEIDETARQDFYDKAQEILIEDAPMIFMQHQAYLTGVSGDIEGYWIDTSGYYKLQDVKFVK